MAPISSTRRKFDLALCAVLALVAGVVMAWKVPRPPAQRRAVEAVKAYGGWVHYDDEYFDGKVLLEKPPREPGWLRANLAEEYFRKVAHVSLAREFALGLRQENP